MENKVVDGLRCCIEHGTLGGKSCRGHYVWVSDEHREIIKEDAHEDECPYKDCETGCVVTLARDALATIEQLEDSLDHLGEMYSDLLDRSLEDIMDEED